MVSGAGGRILGLVLLAAVAVASVGRTLAQEDDRGGTTVSEGYEEITTEYSSITESTTFYTEEDNLISTVPNTSIDDTTAACAELIQLFDQPLNVSVDYPSNTQAHIRWNLTDPELEACLQTVNISTDPELSQEEQPDGTIVLYDLEVCVEYEANLTLELTNGQKIEEPFKLLNYGRFDIDLNVSAGKVYWTYPKEGLRCCEGFEVKQEITYKNKSTYGKVPVSEVGVEEYSYELLDASEECWTRVITITPIHGSNKTGHTTQKVVTLVNIGEVQNVTAVDDGQGRVNISWMPPSSYVECVKLYKVTVMHQSTLLAPDKTSFQFNGDACRVYDFYVAVLDVQEVTVSNTTKSVTVAEEAVGSVRELQLLQSNTEGREQVKWQIPAVSPFCVAEYLVEEVPHSGEDPIAYNVSEFLITLKSADACALASIKVTPISKSGLFGNSSTLSLLNPTQNLKAEQQTLHSARISWNLPSTLPNCVTHFLVFREGLSDHISNITSSELIIDDLKTCKNYTFIVIPVNHYLVEYPPSNVSIVPEEPISAVQNLAQAHNWIEWKFPAKGAGCVQSFIFTQISNRSGDLEFNNTIELDTMKVAKSEATTFRQLRKQDEQCTDAVRTVVTPISVSGVAGEKFEVVFPPPVPSPVTWVRATSTVERQITVEWRKPLENPECVESYRVYYADQTLEVPSENTSVTIERLLACVEYSFTVTAVDFAGIETAGVTANATVLEEAVSQVVDLEMKELEFRSLTAQWKPPENGTNCVKNYRVQAWVIADGDTITEFSDTVTDMHVTFGEVYACAPYYVQVIPVSISNKDGINNIQEIKTIERVLQRSHIESPVPTQRLPHSLELRTNLVNTTYNLCQLTMVRFTCRSDRVPEDHPIIVVIGEAPISDPQALYTTVVEPLTPFTEYNCTARIQNIAGWSEETSSVSVTTEEDIPEQPRDLQLGQGNRLLNLNWSAPLVRNGIITRYRIHIRSVGARYPRPSYCEPEPEFNLTIDLPNGDEDARKATNWNDDELHHAIGDLMPFTDYIVQVAAATKAGLGPYTELVLSSTFPEVSGPVHEFEEYNVTLPVIDEPYNTSVFFSWKLPCDLHGRLRSFMGEFTGYSDKMEFHFDWNKTLEPGEEILERYTFVDHRLEPETRYNVSIMVFVDNVEGHSEVKFLEFRSPAGIPSFKEGVSWGSVNVLDSPNPTNTARISLSDIIFESAVGDIRYVALLLSERRCQEDPVLQRNLSTEWPRERSWFEVNSLPCVPQYQTTPKEWSPGKGRSNNESIQYVIGSEACNDLSEGYCNGPLKPGTEYVLIVRIFTESGFTDSPYQYFQTDSLIQLMLIVSTIFACLLLAFVLGLVVFWRSQKLLAVQQATTRSPNEEPSDIPLKSFSGIYEELIQSNKEKITKEYQAINYFSEQLVNETVTFFVGKENDRKNRYLGILPYDGNRVPLELDDSAVSDEDEEVNDYINASFIDGYKYQREYIATQGPKKETSFDFWRMILQYDVESIVMLTQTVENDRIKCYQYFPRFKETVTFRDIAVKCTQEMKLTFYQKRLMVITRGNQTKTVFHYHFLVWPDHGCPASPTDLIKLIKIIRSERKNLALPVVVHCSAGVGRTGTFIALDIILQRIQQEKKINIYDTVKQLRRQRVKMVQTGEQYAFLYKSCLEYTNRSNRKKPKTSADENSNDSRSSEIIRNGTNGNGRRPLVNIKFPKYVHSGISNVKSYAPDDNESNT